MSKWRLNTPQSIEVITQCEWMGFKKGVTVDYNNIVTPMLSSRFDNATITDDTFHYEFPVKNDGVGRVYMGDVIIARTHHSMFEKDDIISVTYAKIINN